jgi:hypothetical protein
MSAIVGAGSGMQRKTNYVKLLSEGADAGKLRWYKNKDHFITSPGTPLGEIDIRHDKPSLTRFRASMGPKHGIVVKTAKAAKRFQYSSRTEREDMLAEMERWLGVGGAEQGKIGFALSLCGCVKSEPCAAVFWCPAVVVPLAMHERRLDHSAVVSLAHGHMRMSVTRCTH